MMKTNRLIALSFVFVSTLLLGACAPASDTQSPQTNCASLEYIPGARVRSWEQQGVTVIAQIHDIGVQCPPESGNNRHVVRITLRASAGGQLQSATLPYVVQVKSISGRAHAKQRIERQVRFLPGVDGVQITDFFEHRYSGGSEPLIYEVGLDP